ncbi:DEAD/DEAH box helicase [Candidatus Allofournierella merdipullorum]|uniref:DEAD/DEAH box helicase n=1 Tax=Candidatus Allofournierella merdipullorum TaxID=2838595 RepID=UPI002A85C590|nr:DEAD/DEAH box helicase [Candidatus Fournierella merdipullorum]
MLYKDLTGVRPEILQAVERMGFTEMTEVQEKTIPVMMAGHDVIAKAPTGTGKTCAFGIPIIERIDPSRPLPQAVILAPTRELAQQIAGDLEELTHFLPDVRTVCVYGGADMQKQANRLKKGCQIVVATPGRLMDHMRHKSIDVSAVTSIVLDEADEMLNMGFYKDVRKIIDVMKARKSLCMFSATISREVMDIGWLYQRDAEEIIVQPVQASQPKITQYTLCTTGRSKLADVAQIIISGGYKRVMVFCNTKFTTATLTNQLARLNFVTDCLHGDLSQGERNKIMAAFREGKIAVLVATDVAARGIDVEDVDAVINYEVPSSNEYYTHRIGRTGRAKKEGVSYLLYDASEKKRVDELLRLTRSKATPVHWDASHTSLIEEEVDTSDKFQIRSYF